jgi:hypothetical protein
VACGDELRERLVDRVTRRQLRLHEHGVLDRRVTPFRAVEPRQRLVLDRERRVAVLRYVMPPALVTEPLPPGGSKLLDSSTARPECPLAIDVACAAIRAPTGAVAAPPPFPCTCESLPDIYTVPYTCRERGDSQMRNGVGVVACAMALAGCLPKSYYDSASEWTHTEHAAVAARGVERVVLDSRQGPIVVRGTESDSIRIRLDIGPARGAMGVRRNCDLPAVSRFIDARARNGQLRIESGQDLGDECVAGWTIDVPVDVAIAADVTAGSIDVRDVGGGVRVKTSTGRIRIDVASGTVFARSGAGDIELSYDADDFGAVSAKTQVGKLNVMAFGREVGHPRPPGAGDAVDFGGPALNAIDLRASVGDITIRLARSPAGAR